MFKRLPIIQYECRVASLEAMGFSFFSSLSLSVCLPLSLSRSLSLSLYIYIYIDLSYYHCSILNAPIFILESPIVQSIIYGESSTLSILTWRGNLHLTDSMYDFYYWDTSERFLHTDKVVIRTSIERLVYGKLNFNRSSFIRDYFYWIQLEANLSNLVMCLWIKIFNVDPEKP